jgi:hypothetical protein
MNTITLKKLPQDYSTNLIDFSPFFFFMGVQARIGKLASEGSNLARGTTLMPLTICMGKSYLDYVHLLRRGCINDKI